MNKNLVLKNFMLVHVHFYAMSPVNFFFFFFILIVENGHICSMVIDFVKIHSSTVQYFPS